MSPAPAPFDPYRARSEGAGFAPLPSTSRWIFLVLLVFATLGFFGSVAAWTAMIVTATPRGGPPDDAVAGITVAVFMGTIMLIYPMSFVGMYWLYKAWSWLPWNQRYTRHWRSWITPSQAALFLLVPYFQYYWMFMINCALCDALDRVRVSYPTREAAPKGLAIAAAVCQLIVPLPVGAILWLVFMGKIERMTREMATAAAPRMPHAMG